MSSPFVKYILKFVFAARIFLEEKGNNNAFSFFFKKSVSMCHQQKARSRAHQAFPRWNACRWIDPFGFLTKKLLDIFSKHDIRPVGVIDNRSLEPRRRYLRPF